nr:putative zinc finger, CCHC-type [Tanacetum cinerariifolium]
MESRVELLKLVDAQDIRFQVYERLEEVHKKFTGNVASEGSDLNDLQYLMGVLLKALQSSKSEKELDKLVSLVQEIVPLLNPEFPNHLCKLSKALYGLKQAPAAWFTRLSTFLVSFGFTWNDETTITTFISRLNQEFSINDLGDLNYFLGLEVVYTDQGLFLTQSKYASDIFKRANLYDSKASTISFGLTFSRPHKNSIVGYYDADWARCLDTRRSTYGYSICLGGNLVSWSAKKQPTVSRSSCESEYRAMANTASEIVRITHILRELHVLTPDRPTLLCDNKSALFMTQNPVSHKRAKHIDLDYHFIRELVSSGKLYTKFVQTKLQVADIFTKSLPSRQFEMFRSMLRTGSPQRENSKVAASKADIIDCDIEAVHEAILTQHSAQRERMKSICSSRRRVDAAFGGDDESFIFCGNICAKINYASVTTNDKILEGSKTIKKMFPFFEGGVDAAFESSIPNEVYIFRGGEYGLVDYIQRKLIAISPIVYRFKCLKNTIFDSDIGAAFASHNSQEAYLFVGNSYVLLHFIPCQTKDYIISGPKKIIPKNWPSLVNILPRDNLGLDIKEGPGLKHEPDRDPNFVFRVCGNY